MSQMGTSIIRMDTAAAAAAQIPGVVRAAMDTVGMTQRELADATQIPLATLSRRLTDGGRAFDLAELSAVAGALRTTLTEIVLQAERAAMERAAA